MIRQIAFVLLGANLVLMQGCTSIDFAYPRESGYAVSSAQDTLLARQIDPLTLERPADQSGFYPMSDGIDALAARLIMAERAEQSIDVQYYLIKNDLVGKAFILSLVRAADRGVRIRLLLDDMFTSGYDVGLATLDSHPNFEVRVFNPFNRGAVGRAHAALFDFARINRRMHNKSFTVDNKVTLVGGRNIADEYFGAREDAAFGDLDVIAVGPIVQDVSDMFDLYWNHETSIPVPAFIRGIDDPEAALDQLRTELESSNEEILGSKYARAVRDQVFEFASSDESIFRWAPYELVYDSPDKGIRSRANEAASIVDPILESIQGAESEAIVVSPYFVPLRRGIEGFSEIQARGVDVTVVTNSLAANNHYLVHGGYASSRKPLLREGVAIYEVRPDAEISGTEFVDRSGEVRSTLHTKAFVVDRQEVFIGSFNFDPRSANINTELGVIIRDPNLGAYYADLLTNGYKNFAYEVFLDDRDRIRWRGLKNGQEEVYAKEPETSWWLRFKAGFAGILPIRGQL